MRADGGREILAHTEAMASTLASGKLVELDFNLERSRDGLEFVVESADGARIVLDQLVVKPR